MRNTQGSRRSIVTAAILTSVMTGSASVAGAQHVTPAMAGIQIGPPATETVLALAGPLAMPPAGRRLRL